MAQQTPGFVIWFTGLPASGKTTLAQEVKRLLASRGICSVVLDSDELRSVLTPHPQYTDEERDWVYEVISHLAAWLARSGVNVLVAATAHRRIYRDKARQQIERFAEVYVSCTPETCAQRDAKGLYARARRGEVLTLPGIGAEYEAPCSPEATVDTEALVPGEGAQAALAQLARLIAD